MEFQALVNGRNISLCVWGLRGLLCLEKAGCVCWPASVCVWWTGRGLGAVEAQVPWGHPGFVGCGRRALPTDVLGQAPVCVTSSKIWGMWALEYQGEREEAARPWGKPSP